METYCVSCKKYTGNENLSVRKTSQNGLMPELSLKQPGFVIVLVDHLINIVKEFKNLEKQVI